MPIGFNCRVKVLFRLKYNFSLHIQKATQMVNE
jgi:hypothetical protein